MNTYQVIFVDSISGSRTLRFAATSIYDAIHQAFDTQIGAGVPNTVVSVTATKL